MTVSPRATEAAVGTIVVGYHDSLAKAVDDSPWELVEVLAVATSWAKETLVFVMRRVS